MDNMMDKKIAHQVLQLLLKTFMVISRTDTLSAEGNFIIKKSQ